MTGIVEAISSLQRKDMYSCVPSSRALIKLSDPCNERLNESIVISNVPLTYCVVFRFLFLFI